ncbi:hypothetical protein AAMO2058_000104100 [Amorphochlora amoebiformis]
MWANPFPPSASLPPSVRSNPTHLSVRSLRVLPGLSRRCVRMHATIDAGGTNREVDQRKGEDPETALVSQKGDGKNHWREGEGGEARRSQLGDGVAAAIRRTGGPFLGEKESLSPEVVFRSECWDQNGGAEYLRSITEWNEALEGLPESTFALRRVSQISQTTVVAQWNITFIPPSLLGFTFLGRRLPGVEVRFIDILHRIEYPVTGFTWEKLRYLLKCISRGFLPVPYAVIQGTTTFHFQRGYDSKEVKSKWSRMVTENIKSKAKSRAFERYSIETEDMMNVRQRFQDRYDEASNQIIDRVFDALSEPQPSVATERSDSEAKIPMEYLLMRQSEELDLIPYLDAGRLKNRRIANDLLSFLDTRKPPVLSPYEWDNRVRQRCDVSEVPGMGPLDIDGLDPETQSEFVESAGAIITFGVVVVLVLGVGFAALYFQQVSQEAALKQILEEL